MHNKDYRLHTTKPNGNQARQEEIENELFDIQDQLESLGLDGHDITTAISSDHGDIIVSRHVQNLVNYLRQLGTDFEIMRKWMKETYGI